MERRNLNGREGRDERPERERYSDRWIRRDGKELKGREMRVEVRHCERSEGKGSEGGRNKKNKQKRKKKVWSNSKGCDKIKKKGKK